MQNGENYNPVRFDPIEHGVGKAGDKKSSDIHVERSKHSGKLFDGIERGVDLDEKLLAQSGNLLFIYINARWTNFTIGDSFRSIIFHSFAFYFPPSPPWFKWF